jgi:hypothetical protein
MREIEGECELMEQTREDCETERFPARWRTFTVDMNRKSEDDRTLRADAKRPFALWIGVLTALKSPLEMIDIARAIPEMDFVMIGSTWATEKYIANQLVAEKPANLHYLGPVSNRSKRDLIQKCSVGLTTSKYEGFGLTPFEFLTAGKPVLSYPLKVFKEVYGDLIIYANNVSDFVKHIRHLRVSGFEVDISQDTVCERQKRYSLHRAARNIMNMFELESLVIFTQDVDIDSDCIAGFYLVQWKLWQILRDSGVDLRVFANGRKFSREFNMTDRTFRVGGILFQLGKETGGARARGLGSIRVLRRKIASLFLHLAEPWCYVCQYIIRRAELHSRFIIATGQPQIFAGIIVKTIFRLKLACLIHDAYFYRAISARDLSFPMKVYNLVFTHSLRYVDRIVLVSKTMLEEISTFYPHHDRLMVMWDG